MKQKLSQQLDGYVQGNDDNSEGHDDLDVDREFGNDEGYDHDQLEKAMKNQCSYPMRNNTVKAVPIRSTMQEEMDDPVAQARLSQKQRPELSGQDIKEELKENRVDIRGREEEEEKVRAPIDEPQRPSNIRNTDFDEESKGTSAMTGTTRPNENNNGDHHVINNYEIINFLG